MILVMSDILLIEPGEYGHMVILRGHYVKVPIQTSELITMLLLGLGLMDIAGVRRRFKK